MKDLESCQIANNNKYGYFYLISKVLPLTPKSPRWQMCHFTFFGHVIVALWSWFFENFTGGGKMNKVHGKTILTQNELYIQKLWQETYFFASFCPCHAQGKFYLFFYFNCYILTICAANFCETFCTCSPSSLGQDITFKNAKKKVFLFGLFGLEMVVLRWFLK
jgi:hypothetical protein